MLLCTAWWRAVSMSRCARSTRPERSVSSRSAAAVHGCSRWRNSDSLAHNVPTREEVDEVLETARRAGADPVRPATEREWGGYTGYFGDPDGFRWEIAHNPGPIGQEVLP